MMQFPWSTVNGVESTHIGVQDRGLHYGDGLFETLLLSDGVISLLERHIQRLLTGAQKLGLTILRADIERYIAHASLHLAQQGVAQALIKLIVTRGVSDRGYYPAPSAPATCVLLAYPAPQYSRLLLEQGAAVALCQQPLPTGDTLAGMKHLNRLQQVMIAAEWKRRSIGFAEGLSLDTAGNVIEGTFSNVWLIENGRAITPDTTQCGVNGVMRDHLLDTVFPALGMQSGKDIVKLDRLLAADEVFLCNSIYGIWPVSSLEIATFSVGAVTQRAIAYIRSSGYDALYH